MTEQQRYQGGQYVEFRLSNESYGVPIGSVREIITLGHVTRLPEMPSFVEGIIDLRGRIIPIIDLRKRFGVLPEEQRLADRTVVAEIGGVEAGLLVDDVVGVVHIPDGSIQAPQEIASGGNAVVQGLAKLGDRLIILLDPSLILPERERVLTQQEVFRNAMMQEAAGKGLGGSSDE